MMTVMKKALMQEVQSRAVSRLSALQLAYPSADGLGPGAAVLAHAQVHRTLPPHPQGNPILQGQMTAGGGASEP